MQVTDRKRQLYFWTDLRSKTMRLFQQNCVRRSRSLDGVWDFRMEGFEKAYRLPVPGAFEQHPDFMTYTGRYPREALFQRRESYL